MLAMFFYFLGGDQRSNLMHMLLGFFLRDQTLITFFLANLGCFSCLIPEQPAPLHLVTGFFFPRNWGPKSAQLFSKLVPKVWDWCHES